MYMYTYCTSYHIPCGHGIPSGASNHAGQVPLNNLHLPILLHHPFLDYLADPLCRRNKWLITTHTCSH